MNIRGKLLVLIVIIVVAFAIAGTTYFVLRSQTDEIKAEQATLATLRSALLDEGFQANGLASGQVKRPARRLQPGVAAHEKRFSGRQRAQGASENEQAHRELACYDPATQSAPG